MLYYIFINLLLFSSLLLFILYFYNLKGLPWLNKGLLAAAVYRYMQRKFSV